MWYVIQTITGKEQELVNTIKQVMIYERKKYQRCFVIYQECAYRVHGVPEFHIEPLFPSYVFAETDTPEEFFLELKRVPKMSKLLGTEGCFWSIHKKEEEFLLHMMQEGKRENTVLELKQNEVMRGFYPNEEGKHQDKEYLIRPSLVQVDEDGRIKKADGILGCYIDKIVKQRLRKRSVVIEVPFGGKKRRIRLGIRLEGDSVE